ncbi:hypothetical protein [Mesorhizobium sp.]|uniref:hypothetical protein n=1 Tax=Mesorhizobium sp. TaxID=1871066 RepID=UPI0025CF6A37|nr:hypothetical protein [Mesorhizobium sp.]
MGSKASAAAAGILMTSNSSTSFFSLTKYFVKAGLWRIAALSSNLRPVIKPRLSLLLMARNSGNFAVMGLQVGGTQAFGP